MRIENKPREEPEHMSGDGEGCEPRLLVAREPDLSWLPSDEGRAYELGIQTMVGEGGCCVWILAARAM